MDYSHQKDPKTGQEYVNVSLTDYHLVDDPLLNKGIAFPPEERDAFGLVGLLPPHVATLPEQLDRCYEAFKAKTSDLERHIYLRGLQDANEVLFYALIAAHVVEMMPIVYTPVVGAGCQQFSHIYSHPRGLFISYPERAQMDKMLANSRFDHVKAIVVSDGERILGLGDQGAGGMGIPIGKLSLYTACAGIHPANTLPILLDTGTNNPERIKDPLYIGWRHERIRGKDYDDFIERFVQAILKRFPHVLLQWEDFAQQNANAILSRYRDTLCTFNDDIQGTAAIAVGTLLAAVNVTGTRLRDQRIALLGGGSAGCGISELIVQAMIGDGLSEKEARSRFFIVDRAGLLMEGMKGMFPFQEKFFQSRALVANWKLSNPANISLKDVVQNVHPTLLIGVSGQPGTFTEEIVRDMASHVDRPVIFPLSNPTSRSEATPQDLIRWTNDKVVVGTGSPFGELMRGGKPFRIDQTNNCYIFPGMGLGLVAVQAKRVTDAMFMVAAKALADCSPSKNDPKANLLPPLTEVREVSYRVALAVAQEAQRTGLAQSTSPEELEKIVRARMWKAQYLPYRRIKG